MTGIYLFDKNQNLIESIKADDLIENTLSKELNGLITATIRLPYRESLEDSFYFGHKDGTNFLLYKLRNLVKDNDITTLDGIHVFFDDLKGRYIKDIRPQNVTPAQVMTQILQGTGWSVGVATASHVTSGNFYYKSTLSAFFDALSKWQAEFIPEISFLNGEITSKTIRLENAISRDYGKWFEYGDKLISVIAETNHDEVYTGFVGRGKGEETEGGGFGRKITFADIEWTTPVPKPLGQEYIEIPSATALYGYPDGSPRIGLIEFGDIEDREELLQATYQYALENARPKVQLKAKGITDEPVELGEVCAVIRSDIGIRYKTRIFKLRKDLLSQQIIDFEFGDKVVVSTADRIKSEEKKNEQIIEQIESRLEQIIGQVTNYYFNEDGYNYELKVGNEYGYPAGYYSFDKPIDENPTKVVYVGAGKVLISDSKDPTGDWNWRTAIDSNGIAGQEIVTHSITANKLASDVGQSLDLSSNESIRLVVNSTIEDLDYQDGKSAYELALENGFEGTLQEWIDSLQGEDGRTTYTWIRYADDATGSNMDDDPTGKLFLGLSYNNSTPIESDIASDYTWSAMYSEEMLQELNAVKETVTTHQASIQTLSDSITSEVTARVTQGEDLVELVTSKVEQSEEDLTLTFNKVSNDLKSTDEELQKLATYFRYDKNGAIIGKEGDPIQLFQSNNRIEFREGEKAFAYWEGSTMSVDRLIAEISIIIGQHYIETYDSPVVGLSTIIRKV